MNNLISFKTVCLILYSELRLPYFSSSNANSRVMQMISFDDLPDLFVELTLIRQVFNLKGARVLGLFHLKVWGGGGGTEGFLKGGGDEF